MNTPAILCTSLLLTATSLGAVEWRASAAPQPVVANQERDAADEQLEVLYYRPKTISAFDLESAVNELFNNGDMLEAFVSDTVASSRIPAIQAIGPASIVVAGRPTAIRQVVLLLEQLEAELSIEIGELQEIVMVTTQYQLRYVGRNAVERAIAGFRPNPMMPVPLARQGASISIVEETATVIVHDTPERTAEIMEVITGIDRAAPQVRLTYFLLRGHDARTLEQNGLTPDDLDHNLPAGLVEDLGSMVPVVGFERVSFGVLQGDALSRKAFVDNGFNLELNPANYDTQSGRLSLERVEFQLGGQHFATGASLAPDEYTVLGGVGDVPVFLVLQMTRL